MIAPLRYVISIKRRSKITILAIAIVMMFITSVYIISYSYEVSNKQLVERFQSRYFIISSSTNLLESRVDVKDLRGAYVYLLPARIENKTTYIVAIYDPKEILGKAYQCPYNKIILGAEFGKLKSVSVSIGNISTNLEVLKRMSFKFFPDYWGIINYSMAQSFQNEPNFIITDKNIEVNGLITQSMIKLGEFYYKSSEETYIDLVLLILISMVTIYFFINALLNMEVIEDVRKISIIRALGSSSINVATIYFLRAIYIGVGGMLLGFSFGVVLSYLLPTVLQFTHLLTYIVISIPPAVIEINLLLTLLGSALASIQPIRRSVKIKILEGMRRGAL